jgi:3-hydroxyisobutyrate dehydrogenase-like beta-hydroxyacid dehydrogenase
MIVGLVGVGTMGSRMATRLLDAGHALCLHDIRPEALEPFVARGAVAAGSAREVADRAEVVLSSLPRPETVADAILGPDGVLAGTAIRTTIDLSTIGADAAREIHAAAAARGLRALDAPVSGGPRGAEQGTLCIMAAGSRDAFDAHHDLLAVLGRELVFLGPDPGQGQTMKVLNNMVCASTLAATLEAMVLGAKAGLDADAMLRVLQVSSGRNFHTEDKIGRNVLPGTFDYGFQLGLMLKDVGLCLALADELGVPMPSSEAVRGLYEEAVRRSGETADITTLIAPLEEWAGAEVRSATPR